MWPTKVNFDQPNIEIGQKMANGRLLYLALGWFEYCSYMKHWAYVYNASSLTAYCLNTTHL